jgi:hypothetical protein
LSLRPKTARKNFVILERLSRKIDSCLRALVYQSTPYPTTNALNILTKISETPRPKVGDSPKRECFADEKQAGQTKKDTSPSMDEVPMVIEQFLAKA